MRGEREVVAHAHRRRGPGWRGRSTRSAMFGTTTLMAEISIRGALVADGVHQPRRLQREQAGLLDLDARVGDPLLDHALLGQRLAEGDALRDPAAHQLERPLGQRRSHRMQWWMRPGPRRAWAMAKPPPSSPSRFVGRHPHVVEQRARSGPRGPGSRTPAAPGRSSTPGRVAGHEDHRLLQVARRVGIGLAHDDEDLAAVRRRRRRSTTCGR